MVNGLLADRMANFNFRNEARQALARARTHMLTHDICHQRYAALELRMAMEALTYDRAQAFAAELPPKSYDTWQPRQLLRLLLEIDPLADQDGTVSYGIEDEYGKPPALMQVVGSEKTLNMKVLKKHYDALGNYLHVPTFKQISTNNGHDVDGLATRCEVIAKFIIDVLASPIYNVTLGSFAEILCSECGTVVRKRIPVGIHSIEVACGECAASYTLEDTGQGNVVWKPRQSELQCPREGCSTPIVVWEREIEIGRSWTCRGCSSNNVIRLCVAAEPEPAAGAVSAAREPRSLSI
jgi:hypothetical protein